MSTSTLSGFDAPGCFDRDEKTDGGYVSDRIPPVELEQIARVLS